MGSPSATATLALALGAGALIGLVSQKVRVPALVPLMLAGAVLGPGGLGVIDPATVGDSLGALIAISVAILVFEGSLHLDRETLGHAPVAVRRLLTIGAVVTWLAIAAAGVFILGLPARIAVVLGAILIVTGPTVIQPLLQRVRLSPRLHAVLLSEGILIDPIGVVATVVTLEIVLVTDQAFAARGTAAIAWAYAAPFVFGSVIGVVLGLVARWSVSRSAGYGHEGDRATSLTVIAVCVLATGVGELVHHESGLVAAAWCGVIVARSLKRQLQPARRAAEALAAVLVGLLFVLLAATFDLRALAAVSPREAVFLAVVMFGVRPVAVILSTWGSRLNSAERMYLALIAPRGIVAVSAAALAGGALAQAAGDGGPSPAATTLPSAVLLVVIATVLWTGVMGAPLASLLGVRAPAATGLIVAGANRLARDLAALLTAESVPVRLVDTNGANCFAAERAGLDVRSGDATDTDWLAQEVISPEHGALLAVTGNPDVDRVVARWGASVFGPHRSAMLEFPAPEPAPDRLRARPPAGRDAIAMVESGRWRIEKHESPNGFAIPFLAIRSGRVMPFSASVPDRADAFFGIVSAGVSPHPLAPQSLEPAGTSRRADAPDRAGPAPSPTDR